MTDNPFKLKVTEEVDAELLIRTATGTLRPPTPEEIAGMGLVSRSALRERKKALLAMLGDDDGEEPLSTLRYFIEYITIYDHEPPDDAIEGMRKLLWPDGDRPGVALDAQGETDA